MESVIDYASMIGQPPYADLSEMLSVAEEEFPYAWAEEYRRGLSHAPNLLRISVGTFEYIFDAVQLAVAQSTVDPANAVEDRVVAVHGRSAIVEEPRRDQLMRKRPLGPADIAKLESKYDKGHFIAHSIGGGLEINIFPQLREVNRGWAGQGAFRAMESYCQAHPGTYCFMRPIYAGKSWHPAQIEYGVVKGNGTLWLEQFANCGSCEEVAEMERLVGPVVVQWHLTSKALPNLRASPI